MKVSIEDENNFIVFLNNKNFFLDDKNDLEQQFKSIFNDIKLRYQFDVSGYYDIIVYKDKIYGMILSMKKEDIEYLDYFDNQVEMRIVTSPYDKFIYKLENNDLNIPFDNCEVRSFRGNIYIIPHNNVKNIEFAQILEYTTVKYGEEADKIIKYSKKMR